MTKNNTTAARDTGEMQARRGNPTEQAANTTASAATRLFVDIAADGTAQGKSTVAARLRAHCEDAGLTTTLVRIESQHVAKGLRDGDILIPVEMIGESSKMIGGIVGIMEPGLQAISRMMREGGAVLFDWGGGLGDYRLETLAAAGLDHRLAAAGVPAWSVVVTTANEPSLSQAVRVLERTAAFAPHLQRAVVLNAVYGDFAFAPATQPGKLLSSLRRHEGLAATLQIPLVAGQSLSALAPLAHDHRALLEYSAELAAAQLGVSDWVADACLANFAQWYEASRKEVAKMLPFLV